MAALYDDEPENKQAHRDVDADEDDKSDGDYPEVIKTDEEDPEQPTKKRLPCFFIGSFVMIVAVIGGILIVGIYLVPKVPNNGFEQVSLDNEDEDKDDITTVTLEKETPTVVTETPTVVTEGVTTEDVTEQHDETDTESTWNDTYWWY